MASGEADDGSMNVRKALAIAATNLRRLTRDRTGMFFVFVFPFLIILAVGAAFGSGFTPRLGVVADGSGVLIEDLAARLEATGGLEVRSIADAEALRTAVERGEIEGGLVIPADYDARIREGATLSLEYLARATGAGQELRMAAAAVVDEQSIQISAARFAVDEGAAAGFDQGLDRAEALAQDLPRVRVASSIAGGGSDIGGFDTGAAQSLVLFIFVTSLSASSMLIETRRLGVTRRMLASPTTLRTILAGETLGRYAIALLQGVLIVVGSALLFRVHWGDPITTGLVVLLLALAATGAAMVMGSILRDAAQAGSVGVFLGLVLAALGGCMVPLDIFPPVMNTIAHITPHAWAIESLTASITTGAGPAEVGLELSVLAAYAVGLLTIATPLLRRTIMSRV
jgi:ABC-2 type transport system permease protein